MQHQQYAEERGLLGSLCPGEKKLEGKTFYLDGLKKRSTALLLEAVSLLGGRVESFLHKDVCFIVTGSQEAPKEQKYTDTKAERKGTSEEAKCPIMQRESILSSDKRRQGTPRPTPCGSRGKALLEKAIRNIERLQGTSVLDNARSWGVKILYVDDVLLYLKQLTRESVCGVLKRPEKTSTKQQGFHVVKAAALRSPFIKIEDISRKYKPLHLQSMVFPTLWYSGRFSPFESPPPLFEKKDKSKIREKKKIESSLKDKSQTTLCCTPSPLRPRKKDVSFCECCHQPFTSLEEHLQSDQHRAFVLDASNYSVLDELVAGMLPGFAPQSAQPSDETPERPLTPLPVCELEPLTDAEAEHAVRALQGRGSSLQGDLSSPARGPRSSPGVHFPIPDSPLTQPADLQPFSDIHPRTSSPVMPVLQIEPQAHNSASVCPSPDPYSLPPVLSPQVPCGSNITESHCPYSEPPVLSPQQYTAEEAVEIHTCEMDHGESVSMYVPDPFSTTHISVALAYSEGVQGSDQGSILGLSENIRSPGGLACATKLPRRSRSLPRQMATTPNPRKRCRSASPEQSRSKRRRFTAEFGYTSSWVEQVEPESDIAKHKDCLLFDKVSCQIRQSSPKPEVSSTCTVKTLESKPTFTMFFVPTEQNFTEASTGLLGHARTSGADLPSKPLSLQAKTSLCFPGDNSQSAFSSLSHSTSVCIESALIPDLGSLPLSSSDSEWDCGLLSRLGPSRGATAEAPEQRRELSEDLLHRPCAWMRDASYESRLHTVLQPSPPATSLCGEKGDPSAFSRTVVQIVEVQH
ncbi:dbf4b [Pungitius sinensis]